MVIALQTVNGLAPEILFFLKKPETELFQPPSSPETEQPAHSMAADRHTPEIRPVF